MLESYFNERVGNTALTGWVPIAGDSMWPSLKPGDRAQFQTVSAEIQLGDVVVTCTGQRLISHRIIRIEGDLVVTAGDNCRLPDPACNAKQILGKLGAVERGSKIFAPSAWNVGPKRLGRLWLRAKGVASRLKFTQLFKGQ